MMIARHIMVGHDGSRATRHYEKLFESLRRQAEERSVESSFTHAACSVLVVRAR
jgi:hypothetical protein